MGLLRYSLIICLIFEYGIYNSYPAIITTTSHLTSNTTGRDSMTRVPLRNELQAPLVAVLDMTSVNNELEMYIKQTIDDYMSSVLPNIATTIMNEKMEEVKIPLLQSLQDRMDMKLEELQGQSSQSVVFYAVYSGGHTALANRQIAIYDSVYTNIGNAYNAYTGIFTVPVNGLYVFDSTVVGYGGTFHLQMIANENEIGRGFGAGPSDTGSIHAIVSLNKNDVVRLRHFRDTSETMHGGSWNSFSGRLISTE